MRKILFTMLLLITAHAASAQNSAIRVNTLTLATGTLNAGADIAIADKWSIDGSVLWNPIATDKLSLKTLAGTIGVRRWRFEPHVGLFWGVHSTIAQYDYYNTHKRYKGWTVGVGTSIGYSWMLSKRWNFSLEGGLGLFYMQDRNVSLPFPDTEDIVIRHYKRLVLLPSKLEVSFSYLF